MAAPNVPGVNVGDPLSATSMGTLVDIPVFNIRNGPVTAARSIFVRPTIPVGYRWVPVEGLPYGRAIEFMGAYVRSAYGQLDTNRPTGMTDDTVRREAIIIGAARAVMTAFYQLSTNDFIPGELVGAIYEFTPATTATPPVPESMGVRTSDNRSRSAQGMADVTEAEQQVMSQIANCALGILPLQGYSLIMVGHHYISTSPNQSKRAFEAVEKQFWKGSGVAQFFKDNEEIARNAAWHKSGHPVSISLKLDLAQSRATADMLTRAGIGSAAARLPAVESDLRAANAYTTLCATVEPLFNAYAGSLDYSLLVAAVAAVEAFPHTGSLAAPTIAAAAQPVLDPRIVPVPTNRSEALAVLKSVMARNIGTVAYCYGFYEALMDVNALQGGVATKDTLRSSFSLSKLRQQSMATYVSGGESFRDYQVARAKMREQGIFQPPMLSFN